MPAKKSNIGRTTRNTRETIRSRETCEERDERQQVERKRAATSRARETSEERDERQEVDRIKAANSRARETSEERDARQEVDRSRHIQLRTTIDLNKAAFNYDKDYDYSNHRDVQIGTMTYVCFHCRALKFEKETSGMCCSNGKINLPPLAEPPDPLLTYLAGETRESKLFLQHIRKYNSCFQMTSFGATKIVTYDNFMPTFKVQGQVYHLIGSLLPVPEENPQFLFNACLKNSALWRHVKKIQLSTNMRGQTFANQLLDMGDGNLPINRETNEISFPMNFCQLQPSIIDLENSVFPNIANNYQNHDWLRERAILAPKNDDVSKINNRVQMKIPGQATIYKSIDTVTEEDQAVNYRTEFLNSLEPAGMPPHILTLKIGSPILLLRNLNTPQLCNGTRLSVKKMTPNVIEATIINNKYKGEDVLIPRIPMIPDDLPFTFKRLQFPVRLAFAMTINKAQGQSLQVAGLNLENPCFSHGQLYVACSRVGTPRSLYVYTPNQKTKNIVHPLALR